MANGFLGNIAANYKSVALAIIAVALSYLCLSWEKKTTLWWGFLITSLRGIERNLIEKGEMVKGYETYPDMPASKWFVKPSSAIAGIYILVGAAWVIYGVYSWDYLWKPI